MAEEDELIKVYDKCSEGYHRVDDFRAKLLGFLPLQVELQYSELYILNLKILYQTLYQRRLRILYQTILSHWGLLGS